MNIYDQIKTMTDEMAGDLVAQRRDFHKYAEPGWFEMRTSSIIARKLTDLGYEVLVGDQVCKKDSRMGVPSDEKLEEQYERAVAQGADPEFVKYTKGGMTGVIGILRCGEGPTVAMRFDIDALGVFEEHDPSHRPAKEGFNSVNEGFMHACGHDGHATIGLGVAKVLMSIKDQLHGTVKLIFQPAEEGVRGARPMAESGIVDDVDFLYCGHLGCDIPGGTVVTAPEKFLCTTKLDYRFRGTPSHAGMQPEVGRNALMAAAGAAMSLMALPRHGEGMTRVNVGYLRAGEGRNVIASTAEMQVEVRGETAKINTYMYEEAKARVQGAAAMYGVSVEEEVMGEAVDFVPDLPLRDAAAEVAKNAPYVDKVQTTMNFNGSDDATVLIKRVQEKGGQGAYLVVGSDLAAGHHQSAFDFEEKHLLTLFTIYRDLILRHLGAH